MSIAHSAPARDADHLSKHLDDSTDGDGDSDVETHQQTLKHSIATLVFAFRIDLIRRNLSKANQNDFNQWRLLLYQNHDLRSSLNGLSLHVHFNEALRLNLLLIHVLSINLRCWRILQHMVWLKTALQQIPKLRCQSQLKCSEIIKDHPVHVNQQQGHCLWNVWHGTSNLARRPRLAAEVHEDRSSLWVRMVNGCWWWLMSGWHQRHWRRGLSMRCCCWASWKLTLRLHDAGRAFMSFSTSNHTHESLIGIIDQVNSCKLTGGQRSGL